MIDVYEALAFCGEHFPEGPERLAERLGASVEYHPLDGCEGWCVQGDAGVIIRINSSSPLTRQRFTLAHELAHLLLHTAPDVEILVELGCPVDDEERSVNNLAAQMLLPSQVMIELVTSLPIPRRDILAIAAKARSSDAVVAQRIVQMKGQLGIANAFFAEFRESNFWVSPAFACPPPRVRELLTKAKAAYPNDYEYEHIGRQNSVAIFETPWSTTMLVQSVKPNTALASAYSPDSD
ncbi:MAG TPA: ImmA/IrrE family metallo-endopeptidase [Pirellulales bacterium]|nr:ImmA/IrrE family metallo-endopeptidase [Pirellulales bacterium]